MKVDMAVTEFNDGKMRAKVFINGIFIPELYILQTEDTFFKCLRWAMRAIDLKNTLRVAKDIGLELNGPVKVEIQTR